MKNPIYILVLFIILFGSCTGIRFKKPLPLKTANLNTYPKEYQGKYMLFDDTIEICSASIKFYQDKLEEYFISDSLILRAGKQDFYLNKKYKDFWAVLRCVPFNQDSIQIYRNLGILNKNESIKKLNIMTRLGKHEDCVILNPRKKQVEKIFNSEFFDDKITIIRIK